ncbi:aromatic-L-amino-acid decarboxylase-like [Styela clava]
MAENRVIPENGEKFYRMGMSDEAFTKAAKDMIEYVIGYYKSLDGRQAFPSVQPGFMRKLIPENAPQHPEKWEDLFADLDKVVMEGMTHWQSSRFFAYFPCATSYPAILGDILSDACACIGFTWASSPSCTELETVVLDWLGKAIGLPDCFIHKGVGPGLGVVQGTASEATIMTILAARTKTLKKLEAIYPNISQHELASKLVAYTSEYSHSSVERACLIAMVHLHKVTVDKDIAVRGEALKKAMEKDKDDGRIPFYVCATLGTTACCSFDNLQEIGEVCNKEDVWLHVDAAYAGCSFICPEFRHRMKGIEMVTSYNFNPHKWLMVNFDFSPLWVKNSLDLINSFKLNPLYLRHDEENVAIDYRHCQIPLGRKFRALKLWFVFRLIGIEGLRHKIREDVALAKMFESYVLEDKRFEIVFSVELGLVCFRLKLYKNDRKKNRDINDRLLRQINDSREIHFISSEVEGIYFLRVSVGVIACDENAVKNCWEVIKRHTNSLFDQIDPSNN